MTKDDKPSQSNEGKPTPKPKPTDVPPAVKPPLITEASDVPTTKDVNDTPMKDSGGEKSGGD